MLSQVLQSVERKSLASVLRVGIKYACGWAVLECVRPYLHGEVHGALSGTEESAQLWFRTFPAAGEL